MKILIFANRSLVGNRTHDVAGDTAVGTTRKLM